MNIRRHLSVSTLLKALMLLLWVGVIAGLYWFIHSQGIRLREVPQLLKAEVLEVGFWGPLLVLVLYVASTIIPLVKGSLDVASGTIYGPWWGSLIVTIGLNLAAMVAFFAARFFGRHFVHQHEKGWVKKYDDLLSKEGFMTVLLMRMLWFPFDLVSFGCGLTRISFRQFVLGTFLGSIPPTITLVALGGSFDKPRNWIIFGLIFILSLALALILRRLPSVKKKLYKEVPSQFE